jgi:hypothetical protein
MLRPTEKVVGFVKNDKNMKKIINLTEEDLIRIAKKVLNESGNAEGAEMPETPPAGYDDLIAGVFNNDENEEDETGDEGVA